MEARACAEPIRGFCSRFALDRTLIFEIFFRLITHFLSGMLLIELRIAAPDSSDTPIEGRSGVF